MRIRLIRVNDGKGLMLSRIKSFWINLAEQGQSEFIEVGLLSPVGLNEDAVDVIEIDDLLAGPDGFEHTGEAEVACFS